MHEAWSVLAALAAATERVELGQLVMCMSFRNPALLAKMAVTVDEISGGRLTLGVGAGWHDPEYLAFGFPTDHRVSRFEEGLEIMIPLLRGETVTFNGRFHTVTEAVLLPPPSRRIPLLIASKGERMLRLTARHADAWNTAWFQRPDERFGRRVADFEKALGAQGRERSSVRVTVGVDVRDADLPEARGRLAVALGAFADLGVDDVIVALQPMTVASLDRLAEGISLWSEARAAS
jgi:alkanesulfonate monooxygenase SsuD/methylene tetrahydromethanopterin reductase-like flavin-dependent oxidoreductase (luciferase family)